MAKEWLRSLLVFLVVAASFDFTNGQHCLFLDSSWQGPWWTRNVPGTKIRTFTRYSSYSEIHFQQVNFGDWAMTNTYSCKEDYIFNDEQRYYFIDPNDVVGEQNQICVSIVKDSRHKILIRNSKSTGSTDNTPRVCHDLEYTSQPKFFFKYPLDYVEYCPFQLDHYSITVRRGKDPGPMCESGNYMIHMNRAIGEMTIHACFSENRYTAPFRNAKLKCVGSVLPFRISSTYHKGTVFFFAYTSKEGEVDAGMTNIYTARYREAHNGTVFMSLQGSTSGIVRPDGNKDFKSFGALDVNDDFSYAFVLKPTCPDITCLNGGTCQGYTCLCGMGFKGTFCEIVSLISSVTVTTPSTTSTTTTAVPTTTTTITASRPSTTTSRGGGGGGGGTPSVPASTTQNIVIGTGATTDSNITGPEAQRGDGGNATPTIVGIVVAVLALLIILGVVAYFVLKRRKKEENQPEDEDRVIVSAP